MVVAGLGMGLLQPVYTIAVQNVAPRERMGTATSSTIFFRSIGSTVGVAAFGSVMLTRYHDEFLRLAPPGLPAEAMPYLTNPILLAQSRPELAAIFLKAPGGLAMVQPRHRFSEDRAATRSSRGVLLRRRPDGRGCNSASVPEARATAVAGRHSRRTRRSYPLTLAGSSERGGRRIPTTSSFVGRPRGRGS